MIYFDHAASSFPKPASVVEAVTEALTDYAANPGRGSHKLSEKAAEVIYNARTEVATFFGLSNMNHVLFYQNATMALNQAIRGYPFEKGDHVITTSYEHNSVRRPLEALKKERELEITYVQLTDGNFDERVWSNAIQENTKLIAITHASNVTGMLLPLEEIAQFANDHDVAFLVDASQTAGVLPINMQELNIDMLAFPGHKSLLGPQGIGGLLIRDQIHLLPLVYGGTGSHSEEIGQPQVLPNKYESGTMNTPGIAGLLAGIQEVKKTTLEAIYTHEMMLTTYCIERLQTIPGIRIYGPLTSKKRVGVIAFSAEGVESLELAIILDQHYQIAVRAGLHCSLLTHETLETLDNGLVRVSFGMTNTTSEIDTLIDALIEIMTHYVSNE